MVKLLLETFGFLGGGRREKKVTKPKITKDLIKKRLIRVFLSRCLSCVFCDFFSVSFNYSWSVKQWEIKIFNVKSTNSRLQVSNYIQTESSSHTAQNVTKIALVIIL